MEVRNLIDRYLASTVRRSNRPPAFPRRRNSGPRDPNLRTCRLAMDAERRQNILHGMASRERLPGRTLGPLLRTDDDLPAGDRLADPPCVARNLESLVASRDQVPGHRIHLRKRSPLHPPVLPRLVRLPRETRRLRRLL